MSLGPVRPQMDGSLVRADAGAIGVRPLGFYLQPAILILQIVAQQRGHVTRVIDDDVDVAVVVKIAERHAEGRAERNRRGEGIARPGARTRGLDWPAGRPRQRSGNRGAQIPKQSGVKTQRQPSEPHRPHHTPPRPNRHCNNHAIASESVTTGEWQRLTLIIDAASVII